MAKFDTVRALQRRGIPRDLAEKIADATIGRGETKRGLRIDDLKKMTLRQLLSRFSNRDILYILDKIAQINSNFIFKIWKGSEEKNIIHLLKNKFKSISYFKPRSSRSESSEIFIVACGFIG